MSNYMKVQGIVKVGYIGDDGVINYNTVTKAGKALFMGVGIAKELSGATPYDQSFGRKYVYSDFTKMSNNGWIEYTPNKNMSLMVIESNDSLTEDSNKIPVYNKDWTVDLNKVKVVCGMSNTEKDNAYRSKTVEGFNNIDLMDAVTWIIKAGTVDKFNKLVVGTDIKNNKRFDGFGVFKDLSLNGAATSYIRPGVPGITTDSEILLKGNCIYNFETGVFSNIPSTDPRYNKELGFPRFGQVVKGETLYYLAGEENRLFLWKWDIKNEFYKWLKILDYASPGGLFIKDNTLHYVANKKITTISDEGVDGTSIELSTINLPSEFNIDAICIGNYGSNYVVTDYVNKYCVICSNILDVNGSIIDIVYRMNSAVIFDVNGVRRILRDVAGMYNESDDRSSNSGMCLCIGQGNMVSFVQYPELQMADTEKDMVITYGYQLV